MLQKKAIEQIPQDEFKKYFNNVEEEGVTDVDIVKIIEEINKYKQSAKSIRKFGFRTYHEDCLVEYIKDNSEGFYLTMTGIAVVFVSIITTLLLSIPYSAFISFAALGLQAWFYSLYKSPKGIFKNRRNKILKTNENLKNLAQSNEFKIALIVSFEEHLKELGGFYFIDKEGENFKNLLVHYSQKLKILLTKETVTSLMGIPEMIDECKLHIAGMPTKDSLERMNNFEKKLDGKVQLGKKKSHNPISLEKAVDQVRNEADKRKATEMKIMGKVNETSQNIRRLL